MSDNRRGDSRNPRFISEYNSKEDDQYAPRFVSRRNIRENMHKLHEIARMPGFGLIKAFNDIKLHQLNPEKEEIIVRQKNSERNRNYARRAYENSMDKILEGIENLFIDFNVITLEGGDIGRSRRELRVDGLVGWDNFLHGRYGWGVLCATYFDGVCEAVALHEPLANETYTAGFGEGAFLDRRMLRIPSDFDIPYTSYDIGCRALSIGYLVSGRISNTEVRTENDISWRPMLLMVEEARGKFTETDGLIHVSAV